MSQTPNNKVIRRKYEKIPKASVPREKSQIVETMPKLAERSQRSRQRARMGIKTGSEVNNYGLRSPKKMNYNTPKGHQSGTVMTGAITS